MNRFDYDGDYGTVLNRFLIQAAIGYPLTVHGTGGQTRAFIHIQDSVRCIELALGDAPEAGERVRIFNQMTETHRVRDLAELVAKLADAKVAYLPNPAEGGRRERPRREERPVPRPRTRAHDLGGGPARGGRGRRQRFAHRIDRSRVPAVSAWTKELGRKVNRDPEGKALKSVS